VHKKHAQRSCKQNIHSTSSHQTLLYNYQYVWLLLAVTSSCCQDNHTAKKCASSICAWSSPWLVDPNCANKLSTYFKAPYTSSECKILNVISKPLTFAENSAFWGAVWGPVRILHPLWQGKGTFLNLPRSTSASGYKHYKFI